MRYGKGARNATGGVGRQPGGRRFMPPDRVSSCRKPHLPACDRCRMIPAPGMATPEFPMELIMPEEIEIDTDKLRETIDEEIERDGGPPAQGDRAHHRPAGRARRHRVAAGGCDSQRGAGPQDRIHAPAGGSVGPVGPTIRRKGSRPRSRRRVQRNGVRSARRSRRNCCSAPTRKRATSRRSAKPPKRRNMSAM